MLLAVQAFYLELHGYLCEEWPNGQIMQLYFEIGSDLNYEMMNSRKIDPVLGLAPDLQLVTKWLVD